MENQLIDNNKKLHLLIITFGNAFNSIAFLLISYSALYS